MVVDEGLVHWDDVMGRVSSWEPMELIERRFPELILADKDHVNEGGVDTCNVSSEVHEAMPSLSQEMKLVNYDTRGSIYEGEKKEERASKGSWASEIR